MNDYGRESPGEETERCILAVARRQLGRVERGWSPKAGGRDVVLVEAARDVCYPRPVLLLLECSRYRDGTRLSTRHRVPEQMRQRQDQGYPEIRQDLEGFTGNPWCASARFGREISQLSRNFSSEESEACWASRPATRCVAAGRGGKVPRRFFDGRSFSETATTRSTCNQGRTVQQLKRLNRPSREGKNAVHRERDATYPASFHRLVSLSSAAATGSAPPLPFSLSLSRPLENETTLSRVAWGGMCQLTPWLSLPWGIASVACHMVREFLLVEHRLAARHLTRQGTPLHQNPMALRPEAGPILARPQIDGEPVRGFGLGPLWARTNPGGGNEDGAARHEIPTWETRVICKNKPRPETHTLQRSGLVMALASADQMPSRKKKAIQLAT